MYYIIKWMAGSDFTCLRNPASLNQHKDIPSMEGYSSNTLRNCRDIEEVIKLINGGSISEGIEGIDFTPEELAAEYAYDAAKEDVGEECIGNDDLEAHLDILVENGANFSYSEALEEALQYIK